MHNDVCFYEGLDDKCNNERAREHNLIIASNVVQVKSFCCVKSHQNYI